MVIGYFIVIDARTRRICLLAMPSLRSLRPERSVVEKSNPFKITKTPLATKTSTFLHLSDEQIQVGRNAAPVCPVFYRWDK